jgi:hypothetical protein
MKPLEFRKMIRLEHRIMIILECRITIILEPKIIRRKIKILLKNSGSVKNTTLSMKRRWNRIKI